MPPARARAIELVTDAAQGRTFRFTIDADTLAALVQVAADLAHVVAISRQQSVDEVLAALAMVVPRPPIHPA